MTIHLRSLRIDLPPNAPDAFPYNLPVLNGMESLAFTTPVTFLVGENGSGKSTLLEALACAADSTTAGAERAARDETLAEVHRLADCLRLTWNKRTRRGFFLRAEDYFGMVKRQHEQRSDLEDGYRSARNSLERMPFANELHDMQQRYGDGLDARSHGESYLAFFQNRFVPGGLYLLDEPETPLSPLRQLGFIGLLGELVEREAQFIIATHSPILMAFPGATLLNFDTRPVAPATWDELEHVTLTRDFLNDPAAFLRHLSDRQNRSDSP